MIFPRDRLLKIPASLKAALLAAPWFFGSLLVGHLVKENFPFSNWPMYANFQKEAYYVYVADGDGQPVPSRAFHETTARIGKQYAFAKKTEFSQASAQERQTAPAKLEAAAAEKMLARLARRLTPEQFRARGGLELIEVKLVMDLNRGVKPMPRTMGKIAAYPPPATGGGE